MGHQETKDIKGIKETPRPPRQINDSFFKLQRKTHETDELYLLGYDAV
jgi:hypothetical protein